MKHTILLTAILATGLVTQALAQSTAFSVDAYPLLGNTQVARISTATADLISLALVAKPFPS